MTAIRLKFRRGPAAVLWCLLPLLFATSGVWAQEPQIRVESKDGLDLERAAVHFRSPEGDFIIDFPDGCDRIRATSPSMAKRQDTASEQDVLYAYCDRGGKSGQGASISAFYSVTGADGGLAGPAEVVERIGKTLAARGVQVVHQIEVSKEFPSGVLAEGTDILAQEPGGAGQVWVRGLLVDGVIYVLEAWNQAGGLWEDPAYQNFFNSFRLTD